MCALLSLARTLRYLANCFSAYIFLKPFREDTKVLHQRAKHVRLTSV